MTVPRSTASVIQSGDKGKTVCAIIGEQNSSVVVDANVRLVPSSSSTCGVSISARPIPGLTATSGGPGGVFEARVEGPDGYFAVVVVGSPFLPVPLPGLGELWIDPTTMTLLGASLLRNGELVVKLPVPDVAALRGSCLNVQAMTGSIASFELSAPAPVVLH